MAKKTFGEVYVKFNGAITKISKLNVEDYEAFLNMMEDIKRNFFIQKAKYDKEKLKS